MVAPACMTDVVLAATKEQQEIICCKAKFLCLLAGRRWGKTIGVIRNRIITRCLENPGFLYLMVAPSLSQVVPELEAIAYHPNMRPFIKGVRTRIRPSIIFKNGSIVSFRTLEKPHLLRRDGYDEIWIDEIQDVVEEVVDRVLLPMLADRRGTLGMSGQPRGEECWFYRRFFAPGQDPHNHPFIRSWRYSILDGLMFQTQRGREEVERLKAVTPQSIWEEEYLAIPVANGRAVFRADDLRQCRRGEIPRDDATIRQLGHRYVVSVDLGRIVDPTAILVLDTNEGLVVHAEVRPLRERHEITTQIVLREMRRWNQAPCVIDTTGSGSGAAARVDEYARFYQRDIPQAIPFWWNPRTKKRMIDQLSFAIEQHRLQIPSALAELHSQLLLYEFKSVGETVTFGAPQGKHDDLVAALAMAWNAALTGWGARPAALGDLVGAFS